MGVPIELIRSQAIKDLIYDLIVYYDAKDFYSLELRHQDKLIALGIRELNSGIEIILSTDANTMLSNYMLNQDPDHQIDLLTSLKASAREKFGDWFDELIQRSYEEYYE